MTEDNQKKLFALSRQQWQSLTEEQKLDHFKKFEIEISGAIIDNDPFDAGFKSLDWAFIQEHENQFNLDLEDKEKLYLFGDEGEEMIYTIENETGENVLSTKYEENEGENFTDEEKLELVNNFLSRYGIEQFASWIIDYKLEEELEGEYKIQVGNYFYNSWYAKDYHQKIEEKEDL